MRRIDIKYLAKQLGVSPSTVSRSLKDSYEISEKTKQKVKDLASLLNYQPHPYASGLRLNKSHNIAVVIADVSNNFFSKVVSGIESIAMEKNYHVLTYLTHDSYEKERRLLPILESGRVEGVILSIASETKDFSHLVSLQASGVPIIFFDRVCDSIKTAKVTTNDFESGYKATEHLIRQGCHKIIMITNALHLSTTGKRRDGYLSALHDNGIPIESSLILECNNLEEAEEGLKEILSSKNRPDGIFTAVEKFSLTPYKVCMEMKISMPSEVKHISFSNNEAAPLLNPSLSTVSQPAFEMGRKTAEILFSHLDDKNDISISNQTVILPSCLIKRKSSARNDEILPDYIP